MPKTLTNQRHDYQHRCHADNKSTTNQACVLGEFGARKNPPCSFSMCLRHGPASGRLESRVPSTRVSAVVCRCFLQIRVPKGRMLMNKNQNGSAKVPKATNIEPKGCPKRSTLNQKGANVSKSCSKIKHWSVRKLVFLHSVFVRQNCKKDHGTRVGLTSVKRYKCGENMEKVRKNGFWHL